MAMDLEPLATGQESSDAATVRHKLAEQLLESQPPADGKPDATSLSSYF
jgi:hypothetical protein